MPTSQQKDRLWASSSQFGKKLAVIVAFLLSSSSFSKDIIQSITIEKNKATIVPEESFAQNYTRLPYFFMKFNKFLNLETLPRSVVTIPFLASIMPVIWVSGKTWTIDVMDKDLYTSLEVIRHVFKLFYPTLDWSGQLVPKKLEKNRPPSSLDPEHSIALLFSGGLDSICSSLTHHDKNQHLITLHGYDVPFEKKHMWQNVEQQCRTFATQYGHSITFATFNLHSFLNIKYLSRLTKEIPTWVEYTSEGLSHTAMAAPILYKTGHRHILIASSTTPEFPFPYGTNGSIDNFISFAGVTVTHDGDSFNRVEKIQQIQKMTKKHMLDQPVLRVCWGKDKKGGNCCACEKCLRTIHELWVVGQDHTKWGFHADVASIIAKTKDILVKEPFNKAIEYKLLYKRKRYHWKDIQAAIQEVFAQKQSEHLYKDAQIRDYLQWLLSIDFDEFYQAPSKEKEQLYRQLWRLSQKKDFVAVRKLQPLS